jgi:hypothetical protein
MAVRVYNGCEVKADLYARIPGDGEMDILLGDTAIGDIPFSIWQYVASSSATDDFANGVIQPTLQSGNGRWLRRGYYNVKGDWNEGASSEQDYILNKPAVLSEPSSITTVAAAARNFNQAYQVSTTEYADVRMSATITCTLSLTSGTSGEIFLEYSADGSTNWILAGKMAGSNTGTLTIGLNTSQITGSQLACMLAPGYYWRMRTNNVTGTATYAFTGGTEIIY